MGMTREHEKLIRDLYQRPPGLGLVAVARLAETSVTTVRRVLREGGVPMRKVGATVAKASSRLRTASSRCESGGKPGCTCDVCF